MNVSALTAMILGQMPGGKSGGSQPTAGAMPPPPPPPPAEGAAPLPNFKSEALKLIPFAQQGPIRARLRKGEPVEGILSELGTSIPGLTAEHIKTFAPPAVEAPKPITRLTPEAVGDYFRTTVGGQSTATIRPAPIPAKTGGGAASGMTAAPRVSVQSTTRHSSIDEAAAEINKKIENGEYAAPEGFPKGADGPARIKYIRDMGAKAIDVSTPAPRVKTEGGRVVSALPKAPVPLVTGQAPQTTRSGHMLPRFAPQIDVQALTDKLYSPQSSTGLLDVFDSVVQGANAGNKSLGEKLKVVHGLAKSGRDYGVWGTLGTAFVQNEGNKDAQDLILNIARGTTSLATANETAKERGWTGQYTKPIVDAWGQTVSDAMKTLESGSATDIKRLNARIGTSLTKNSNLSAFVSNVPFGEFKQFGFSGINKVDKPAPISIKDVAPTILKSAGTVVQNRMEGEFKNSGRPGLREASLAMGRFVDALVNNPHSPIGVQLTKQIENTLNLNDKGTMTPQKMQEIISFVSMSRSNKARVGGPTVPTYVANLVNNLNLPNQLLSGLGMSWSHPDFVRDLDAATDLLTNKASTDWGQIHKSLLPHLNERALSNIMPRTANALTANMDPVDVKKQLGEGTLYTPEQGKLDLYLKTLRNSAIKSGIASNQLNFGIFADPHSTEAGRIANLGLGGQRMLETVKSQNPELYASLIDRALAAPNKKGVRSIPGLRFTGEINADTQLSTQLSNRIWHAVFNPNSPTAQGTSMSVLGELGKVLPEFAAELRPGGAPVKSVATVIPAQKQRAQTADVVKPDAAPFTGDDYNRMWMLWQRLGTDTNPTVKKAINFQLQNMNDKLIKSIGVKYAASGGTGTQKVKSTTAGESTETVQRLLRLEGDKLAKSQGDSAVFQEFRNHIAKLTKTGQVGNTDNVVKVVDMLNGLDPTQKMPTLQLFQPSATRRAVTTNPLGMSNQEFTSFGREAEAIIKTFGNGGDLTNYTDQRGEMAPGERFLRKLSNPQTGPATLQRITELIGEAKQGIASPGRRPAVKTSRFSPTETAALGSVVRQSKTRRAELAGDPITGAGNALGRSMVSNASIIGDKGPAYPAPAPAQLSDLVHQPFMGKQTPQEWLSEWNGAARNLPAADAKTAMWLGRQLTNGKTLTQVMAYDPSGTKEQNASHQEAITGVMKLMAQRSPKLGVNPVSLELDAPTTGARGVVKYNAEPAETSTAGRTPQQKRRAALLGRGLLGFGAGVGAATGINARR